MSANANIKIPILEIRRFCKKHNIRKLAFFGSVLGERFTHSSDIDVLVEFEAGRTPGFFSIAEMENELATIFDGRKVDLRTPNDLSRYFRQDVLSTAEVVYAGA